MKPNCLFRFASNGEAKVARSLVDEAIKNEWTVSVFDGEEWTVKRSTNRQEILDAMATTGEDVLSFRTKSGEKLGTATLIYGNASDGSELVADCSAPTDEALERMESFTTTATTLGRF